jgi:hypothetical protein
MLRSLFVAIVVLFTYVGTVQAAEDAVRTYADSLAKLVVEDNQEPFYQEFAPSLRASYSREDLLRPLHLIRKNYGTIDSYDYRQRIKGQTSFSGRLVGHLTYCYAVETQPATPGAFLLVKVMEENGRLFIAGIDFNQIEGPIPSFLERKKK